MKITIYGAGYVGLVIGACLADVGNEVLCVDVDEERVASLIRGEIPIHEPGFSALIKRNRDADRLRYTTDAEEAVAHGLLQFVTVGTSPASAATASPSTHFISVG
jgi:UDPglucose 6-dehydrogenase